MDFTEKQIKEMIANIKDPKCNALGFCNNKPERAYILGKGELNKTDEPIIVFICKECNQIFNDAFRGIPKE